jgi:hypothetical protein
MRTTAWLRTLLVALAGSNTACSLTFMTTAPADAARGQPRPHVDCTSSYLAPIADSVISTYQLVGVGYAATLDDSDYDDYPISRKTDMAIGAGFAALFAGSALYGYVSAAHCRRVKRGPPGHGYLPGISSLTPARKTAGHTRALISGAGASQMEHRPDPKGTVRKRWLHHEETGPAPSRPQSVE